MARGRKKETLTPEDRLLAALVPESEQPYKVPKNWCCFRFTSLIDIEGGTQPPKSQFINEYREGYIRLVQIRDFTSDKYIVFVPDTAKLKHFDEDDILIARYGASLGRICTGMSGAYNVALAKTIFPSNILNRKYVYWMLQSESFQAPLMGISRAAQAGFNKEDLSTLAMPLPPFSEQQRIVDRIESLLTRDLVSKQKAQEALDSFETRKAAILHKAFTGELTAQWRKEHGVGVESWKKSRFDEVATIKSNLVNPLDYPDLPHIAPDNIEKKTGVLLEYHTVSEDGVTSGKHRFYPGQILYSKIRPYLSKVVVVDFDGLCSADMYPIEAKGNAKCLWYYMLSEEFLGQASSAGSRSVLPKINQKELSALTVVLPTLKDEQEEIVRILDDMFAKEQQAKESTERVLEQIDLIKKAILARAFRGELGTNDPSEGSAVELLKRVLAVEPPPKTRAKAVSIPREVEEQLKSELERKIIKSYYYSDSQSLPIDTLMEVSSKKFELLESIRNLEQRGIIKKLSNGNYKLVR